MTLNLKSTKLKKKKSLLRKSSKSRFEKKEIFVRGAGSVSSLISSGAVFSNILVPAANKFWASHHFESEKIIKVPRDVLKYLVNEQPSRKIGESSDDGELVVGVATMPDLFEISSIGKGNFLALDSVQHPKNVGTL